MTEEATCVIAPAEETTLNITTKMSEVKVEEVNSTNDPRFTLTDEEHEHVLRLKEACDRDSVEYRSIFELAKYSLVCSSIKDPKKRLKSSLERIKKKREFERKHKLLSYDLQECLKLLQEEMPHWIQICGKINDKWCVGYDGSEVDGKYLSRVENGLEKLCLVEMTRYDLAAANLEEARRGFYIIVSGKKLKGNPLNHARMISRVRVLLDKMNANRVKAVAFEGPTSLSWIFGTVLRILPSKLRERVKIGTSLASLELVKGTKLDTASLSDRLGGTYKKTPKEWFDERLIEYEEAEARVVL